MNKILEIIHEKIKQKDWNNEFSDILSQDVIMYKEKAKDIVERNGDIVAGFYLESSSSQQIQIDLNLGGVDIPSLILNPGEFKYFFDNKYIYPIIAIQYSLTHVITSCYDNLYIIYVSVKDSDIRRLLAQSTHVYNLNNKNALIRGDFGFIKDLDAYLTNYPDRNQSYIYYN